MSFKLQLVFTGLCTFVEHETLPKVKVVMVDGRSAASGLVHAGATLRFNRDDLAAGSLQPDLHLEGVSGLTRDSACFLSGEDLAVDAGGGSLFPLTITKGLRPTPRLPEPTQADRADWSWVADLNSIKPGAGDPEPWWFLMPPVPPGATEPLIVARFDLDRGNLSTFEFFRYPDRLATRKFPSIFNFGASYTQALASYVVCEMDCADGTSVKILSTPWGGSPKNRLVFAPRTAGQDLLVEVSNAPFFDVMNTLFPPPKKNDWPVPTPEGHSFLHVYSLHPGSGPGPFPGGNRTMATASLAEQFDLSKGVGCSPSKTESFNF